MMNRESARHFRRFWESRFEVTTAATVGKALTEITTRQFQVLIATLNIGQPGDGFTVVSAMRRRSQTASRSYLTGYPALDTALQAIRSQVDDYLIKPAVVPDLVAAIESKLKNRAQQRFVSVKRLPELLRDNTSEIIDRTLQQMKSHPAIGGLPLSDRERINGFPVLINDLLRNWNQVIRIIRRSAQCTPLRWAVRLSGGKVTMC